MLSGMGMIVLGMLSADWHFKIPFIQQLLQFLPPRLLNLPEAPVVGVHTNNLAGVLQLFVPPLLAVFVAWRPPRFKTAVSLMMGLLFLFTILLLLLTQSRSGWAGTLTGILFVVISWNLVSASPGRKTIAWVSLGIVATIVLLVFILIGRDSMSTFLHEPPKITAVGTFSTLNFRWEVWQWGITAVHDFPFTGTGLGTFRQVVRRFYPLNVSATYDIAHAHNIFLQTALDIGLPGLIAYLAILGIAGGVGWQVAKQDERLRPFALGLLASLIAFHTYGLTDALALGSKPGILFWMVLGLLTAMSNKQVKGNNNQ
jgi:putative inorganic carbon (HCO3(-)) transporter